ncbi:hypothetical protein C7389_1623, partial [Azoarcus indigens]
ILPSASQVWLATLLLLAYLDWVRRPSRS